MLPDPSTSVVPPMMIRVDIDQLGLQQEPHVHPVIRVGEAIDGRPRQLPDVVPVRIEGHGAEALLLQVEAAAEGVALGVVPDVVVVGLELDPLDEVTVGVALGDLTVEVVTRVAALINHRRLMYFF